jgi:alpha-L-fucosidase
VIPRRAIATILLVALALLSSRGGQRALATGASPHPQPIPLGAYFNSEATADFDGVGDAFPADELPAAGSLTLAGVPYEFPDSAPGAPDTLVALGQTIRVPPDHYATAYWLVSASYGPAGGPATLVYADGTQSSDTLSAPDWIGEESGGALNTSGTLQPGGNLQATPAAIYTESLAIDPTRVLESIVLPTTAMPTPRERSLHIFALTLQPLVSGIAPAVLDARPTGDVLPDGSRAVAVHVRNVGLDWITPQTPVTVSVDGPGLRTTTPGTITTLAPVEDARVTVGVQTDASVPPGAAVPAEVTAHGLVGAQDTQSISIVPLAAPYVATDASLLQHQTPDWFAGAKFGIFIHWGVYSVPAWAAAGRAYAEWYWYWMNLPKNEVFQYHQQTYGKDFAYDDFLARFTPSSFDPVAWVHLFQQAGARYFVLTAKHHDGVALFDDQYSHRNTVALGPHRDLLRELFDAARQAAPELKRGVYYSLPEWYNPAYPGSYDRFGHGPPHNPYTGEVVPYTGYIPIADYVRDYQAPQLNELISNYDPDVLWCDIGGPNDSLEVLANYYNHALASGKQVAVNDRCGIAEHDFSTREYSKQEQFSLDKWEENRGLDPYSYGYNANTPASAYVSVDAIIDELVDVVSKNGNLLLGIGPRADGTIPEVMAERLRSVGAWLRTNGEAIYDTTYWSRVQEEHTDTEDLRFTVAPNRALYVIDLHPPGPQEVIQSGVPIRPGDQVTLLGYNGGPLAWRLRAVDGALVIDVPPEAITSGQYAWTFKIAWQP